MLEKKTTIWMVRHGKTMFNDVGRVQGWSDTPLTLSGTEVITHLALGLQEIHFDALYSSDSGRARQTLHIIAQYSQQKSQVLEEDWRLREINFGSYEGELESVMWQEVANAKGLTLEAWWQAFTPISYVNDIMQCEHQRTTNPDGYPAESYEEVRNRLLQSLTDIVQKHPRGSTILVVMHGGSIATLLSFLSPDKHKVAGSIKNGSVSQLLYHPEDGFSVELLNDMSYVEKGKSFQS